MASVEAVPTGIGSTLLISCIKKPVQGVDRPRYEWDYDIPCWFERNIQRSCCQHGGGNDAGGDLNVEVAQHYEPRWRSLIRARSWLRSTRLRITPCVIPK